MKLLTVTVPCYNSQDYMRACVDSLLKGGERVEIIIIDDGSVDDTGRIADEYCRDYPNIVKVIHQANGGHGEGINQGIAHATGTYFKVVDSDDAVSEDFVSFLDALESCEQNGGVDLFVTNYYYAHQDGVGDRAIRYGSALPKNRIVEWSQTRPFQISQLITLHSGTFRTELMRKWKMQLPKHTFYEDNLMVYLTIPFVRKLYYMDIDLYRYTIGREGQSMQNDILRRRYTHLILVSQSCFTSCHLDDIQSPMLKKYMKHELFMMLAIACSISRLNKTDTADADLEQMWKVCMKFDPKWARRYRKGVLRFFCIRGKFGRNFSSFIYQLANKVVRFN